jgi:hypothetical protein
LASDYAQVRFLHTIEQFIDENTIKILKATLLGKGQNLVHMRYPLDVMLNAERFDCVDARDRVIALLHVFRLFKVRETNEFDYILRRFGYFSSVEKVYLIFAQYFMLYVALRTAGNRYADSGVDGTCDLLQVACSLRSTLKSISGRNAD